MNSSSSPVKQRLPLLNMLVKRSPAIIAFDVAAFLSYSIQIMHILFSSNDFWSKDVNNLIDRTMEWPLNRMYVCSVVFTQIKKFGRF